MFFFSNKVNISKYEMNDEFHEYNTRHNDQKIIHRHRTTKFKESPIYNTTI